MTAIKLRAFEDRAVAFLRRQFPFECATRDEMLLRSWVRKAVSKGADWKFDKGEEVFAWLELMVLLGEGFDTDPRCYWAREILACFEVSAKTRLNAAVEEARRRLA